MRWGKGWSGKESQIYIIWRGVCISFWEAGKERVDQQGPAAMTNKKLGNFWPNTRRKRSAVLSNRKKFKKIFKFCFLKEEHLKNLKNLRDPLLGISTHLPMHVNKSAIHLVTPSLFSSGLESLHKSSPLTIVVQGWPGLCSSSPLFAYSTSL